MERGIDFALASGVDMSIIRKSSFDKEISLENATYPVHGVQQKFSVMRYPKVSLLIVSENSLEGSVSNVKHFTNVGYQYG